jgi:tetratricopeptide (TPR) repeat protein
VARQIASYRSAADAPRILETIDHDLASREQTAADLPTPDLSAYASLLLTASRLPEADQAYRILADRNPADRTVLETLALLAGARGDLKAQDIRIAAFEKAFPGDPDALGLRARFLFAKGDRPGAQAAWTAVLQVREDPAALEGLAGLSLDAKKPQAGLSLADRAVKAAPGDDQAWALRARALTDLARYREAQRDLDQAIALAPDDPWHRLDRGKLAWLHLYQPDLARSDLELVTIRDPDNFFGWEALAEVYEDQDRPRQAWDAWLKALSLRPDYRFAYPSAAMLSFRYQDFPRAAQYAHEAAKDYPAEYAFPFVEALSLRALGRAQAAQTVLEKAKPRFVRGSSVDEMFRFLLTPGTDYYLNTALNLEPQENVRLRLRFYQGVSYALAKSVNSARAAFEEVGGSTLKRIPEIAAARDWLDHGL